MKVSGLNYAEKFVINQQQAGVDCRWDGWDIVFFRPDPRGIHSTAGAYRDGSWGFEKRVSADNNGVWEVDWRDIRRPESIRS